MVYFVSKTGVWDVEAGESGTPALKVAGLESGNGIKLTCQFFARTMTDDLGDGFEYAIESNGAAIPLTPIKGFVQGSDSWHLHTHVVLYEVQAGSETHFNLTIGKGSMNGIGSMMNFLLMAETIELNE